MPVESPIEIVEVSSDTSIEVSVDSELSSMPVESPIEIVEVSSAVSLVRSKDSVLSVGSSVGVTGFTVRSAAASVAETEGSVLSCTLFEPANRVSVLSSDVSETSINSSGSSEISSTVEAIPKDESCGISEFKISFSVMSGIFSDVSEV